MTDDRRDTLSSREREVLALREAGRTRREIAELLHISFGTVETYIERIKAKLGNER